MKDETAEEPNVDQLDDDTELKNRLIRRISVAVVLIGVLLGGLAVMDALNTPPQLKPVDEAPVAALSEQKPAAPEEKPVEPVPQEEAKKPEEAPAEPEKTATPAAPNKVERTPRPLTKPAEARQAMLKPSEPLVSAKPPAPIAELVRPSRPAAPASRPLTQPLTHPTVFLLQMGVFNNVANAEELRAKLELNGIPSQIEARVQVGPFKSRQEAEQARDKLKHLGMETGLVVALKK